MLESYPTEPCTVAYVQSLTKCFLIDLNISENKEAEMSVSQLKDTKETDLTRMCECI